MFNIWYLPQVVDAQLCPCCSKLVCQPCIKVSGDYSATCYPFYLPASKCDIGILNPKHTIIHPESSQNNTGLRHGGIVSLTNLELHGELL